MAAFEYNLDRLAVILNQFVDLVTFDVLIQSLFIARYESKTILHGSPAKYSNSYSSCKTSHLGQYDM